MGEQTLIAVSEGQIPASTFVMLVSKLIPVGGVYSLGTSCFLVL